MIISQRLSNKNPDIYL